MTYYDLARKLLLQLIKDRPLVDVESEVRYAAKKGDRMARVWEEIIKETAPK